MSHDDFLRDLEEALAARGQAYADAWKAYRMSTGDADAVSAWSLLWQALGSADRAYVTATDVALTQHADDLPTGQSATTAKDAYDKGFAREGSR